MRNVPRSKSDGRNTKTFIRFRNMNSEKDAGIQVAITETHQLIAGKRKEIRPISFTSRNNTITDVGFHNYSSESKT